MSPQELRKHKVEKICLCRNLQWHKVKKRCHCKNCDGIKSGKEVIAGMADEEGNLTSVYWNFG